jgi:bifunctional enzyme CysN/CysC
MAQVEKSEAKVLQQYLDAHQRGDNRRVIVSDDDARREHAPFRMFVESVDPSKNLAKGLFGRIVGGAVDRGDRVRVMPAGKQATVARIVAESGDLERAVAGQSVTVVLAEEIDASPGDMLVAADSPPGIADQFEAVIIWMDDDEMLPGRPYLLEIGAKTVGVSMVAPKYRFNVDTLEHIAAKTLQQNEIGVCNLNLDQAIAFDPYAENRDTGSFILIDRITKRTLGAGLIHFALRRSQNIHWQAIEVDQRAHAALKGHGACVVWFTGLSGSGKSTIANLVEKKLHALGQHTYLLDGDNVRHGLNKDLGFTEADRVENIRRVGEVARLMVDAGLIVLVAFISPFRAERRMARARVKEGEFCEVFVDAPLAVAESRDTKGLYKKARRGQLANFTGIDSPYEAPESAEVRLDTTSIVPEDAAEVIVARLRDMGVLDPP